MKELQIGVYAILDATVCKAEELPGLASKMALAGIRFFQVRAKNLPTGEFVELVRHVKGSLSADCILIVNDRADIALATGAHGVHVGDEDLPPEIVRKMLGEDAIIGYSTHSIEEVLDVQNSPCDYIGFGPVFESTSKRTQRKPHGVEGLRLACSVSKLPVVAIGGISVRDIHCIRRAGASGVAMISGLLTDTHKTAKAAVAEWEWPR